VIVQVLYVEKSEKISAGFATLNIAFDGKINQKNMRG